MPNEILRKTKVEYSFQSSSYVPTGISDLSSGTPTVIDLSLAGGSGLAATEAMNSDQVNLGAIRPATLKLKGALEFFTAPTVGGTVDFYWSGSGNSAVANGNPGNPDGVDGDYAGDGTGSVAESVKQMIHIGSFVVTAKQAVQIADIGSFEPEEQYGQLVVVNNTDQTVCATDDIESSILMTGNVFEVQ